MEKTGGEKKRLELEVSWARLEVLIFVSPTPKTVLGQHTIQKLCVRL